LKQDMASRDEEFFKYLSEYENAKKEINLGH
jgi:hypothetical protein